MRDLVLASALVLLACSGAPRVETDEAGAPEPSALPPERVERRAPSGQSDAPPPPKDTGEACSPNDLGTVCRPGGAPCDLSGGEICCGMCSGGRCCGARGQSCSSAHECCAGLRCLSTCVCG